MNILKFKSDVADNSAHPLLKYSFPLDMEDRPAVDGIELGYGFNPCLCPGHRVCYCCSAISVVVLCHPLVSELHTGAWCELQLSSVVLHQYPTSGSSCLRSAPEALCLAPAVDSQLWRLRLIWGMVGFRHKLSSSCTQGAGDGCHWLVLNRLVTF